MRSLWIAMLLSGCDGTAPVEVERMGESPLVAQLGTTHVSVDAELARDGDDLILRGHTNRALTGGMALARDGPDGALERITSNAFLLRWPDRELGAIADGEVRMAELDFRSTARSPPTWALRLICGLRLLADGLDAQLARDGDVYEIGGQPIAASEVWAHVAGEPLVLVRTGADGTVAVVQARVVLAVQRMALGEGDPRSVFGADGLR